MPIGDSVLARIRQYAQDSPFIISGVVVGNVQYPAEVADAVARKLAATQELQRKDTEIEIERKERTKREVQAQGIANAMQIIRGQLSVDVHPARGDRVAEADGELAESHGRLHPVGRDGRAAHRDVSGDGRGEVRITCLADLKGLPYDCSTDRRRANLQVCRDQLGTIVMVFTHRQ